MARPQAIEILGTEPWPLPLRRVPVNRGTRPQTLLITPFVGSVAAIARRYPRHDVVVLSTKPSAVEAALLIHAGADAYLTDLADLRGALEALAAGEMWLSPVAATAVCRLARLPGDPAFDRLATFARAVASGQPPRSGGGSGLSGTRWTLAKLRRLL